MQATIKTLPPKKLIGKKIKTSFGNDRTFELWRSFMPRRKEIKNNLTSDLLSMQVYPPTFNFQQFDLQTEFEKWAAVEVPDFDVVPNDMETFILEGGLYAVFLHKGGPSKGQQTFAHIFGTWLPNSDYSLDHRPHFEILGEKYKNDEPDSEEEIWIPIQPRIRKH